MPDAQGAVTGRSGPSRYEICRHLVKMILSRTGLERGDVISPLIHELQNRQLVQNIQCEVSRLSLTGPVAVVIRLRIEPAAKSLPIQLLAVHHQLVDPASHFLHSTRIFWSGASTSDFMRFIHHRESPKHLPAAGAEQRTDRCGVPAKSMNRRAR